MKIGEKNRWFILVVIWIQPCKETSKSLWKTEKNGMRERMVLNTVPIKFLFSYSLRLKKNL